MIHIQFIVFHNWFFVFKIFDKISDIISMRVKCVFKLLVINTRFTTSGYSKNNTIGFSSSLDFSKTVSDFFGKNKCSKQMTSLDTENIVQLDWLGMRMKSKQTFRSKHANKYLPKSIKIKSKIIKKNLIKLFGKIDQVSKMLTK